MIDFAQRIKENYEKIDILMNNAGNAPDNFRITEDGFESCIEGNFLGHVVLTYLLMEHMNEDCAPICEHRILVNQYIL